MKRRLTVAGIVLVILWLASIPTAYNLDVLMTGGQDYTWNPFRALPLVITNGQAARLLVILMAVVILAIVACLTAGSNISTHSGVQRITPDITIPEAAGQGQFGTARFLSRKKYGRVFSAYTLPDDGLYAKLIKEGKNDGKEIEGCKADRE